jgi:fermentation-respiration switch protein FrsA (DUF1100 family)
MVWFLQERLLFYPPPAAPLPAPPAGWKLEEVRLAREGGVEVRGVLLLPPAARPPLVIYFGGNAEEVTANAPNAARVYGERAVLMVNYRGYGASSGRPGETAIVADALALYDWAARRTDLDATRIAVHGRSLGSGVAVQLAAARPVRGVVLTTPFDSAREVAARMYPWLPVRFLMRHPFDSLARAPLLKVPALILIGEDDTLITPPHSRRLAAAWGGPVDVIAFPGFGHNDIHMNPRYDAAIRAFLERHLQRAA